MEIKHESLADIPFIIGFCKRLNLQDMIDMHFKTHGNQEGLTNGQLVMGWIAHILTQKNHCKAPVEEWAKSHKLTLQALLEKEISNTDFEDNRLSRLLEKFANDLMWESFEASFYQNSFAILDLQTHAPADFKESSSTENGIARTIKLDSTTAYGHHEVIEDGIMQRGWSKDHRPDLPQLKIMVSVEGNTGVQIASDVVAGNRNDDPLYVPILERTRKIVDTNNCLICGDSKMSALYIRADIVKNKEFYLTPLQLHDNARRFCNELIEKIVNGDQVAELIFDTDIKNVSRIIGSGFEVSRTQMYKKPSGEEVEWEERALLIRSYDHVEQEVGRFNEKIKKIEFELSSLKSRLWDSAAEAEIELSNKIEKLKKDNSLSELFEIEISVDLEEKIQKRTEKRSGKTRVGTYTLKKYRSRVTHVIMDQDKLTNMRHKIGWRLYITNAKRKDLVFSSAYKFFRKTMYVIEVGFHVLKDYINISPLFVRDEKQILGLTRLLVLALKLLTLMTAEIRANMKKDNIVLTGLYAGQKARKHPSPTAQSLLEYFSRNECALVGHKMNGTWFWGVTALTDTCRSILRLLRIPESIYDELPLKVAIYGLKT